MESINKSKIVSVLRQQVGDLITLYERVKEENKNLFIQNRNLQELIKEKEEKIIKLQEKIEINKLGNAFTLIGEGKDIKEIKHEAKIKINRLIKEIDSCISLLND